MTSHAMSEPTIAISALLFSALVAWSVVALYDWWYWHLRTRKELR